METELDKWELGFQWYMRIRASVNWVVFLAQYVACIVLRVNIWVVMANQIYPSM